MVVDEIPGEEQKRITQFLLEEGGTHEDLFLSNEIIQYVMEKEVRGATGSELKVLVS